MPLSDEELRLLEQMEQALAQEDPKFASTLRGSAIERTAKIRTVGAGVALLVGVAMLMGGAVTQQIWLAVLGFVVMVASTTLGLAAWHGRHAQQSKVPDDPSGATSAVSLDDPPHRFGVVQGGRADKPRRQRQPRQSRQPRARRPKGGTQGTFLQRMEQRWERRRNQGY